MTDRYFAIADKAARDLPLGMYVERTGPSGMLLLRWDSATEMWVEDPAYLGAFYTGDADEVAVRITPERAADIARQHGASELPTE